MKARRGLYGASIQKEIGRFVPKHPMSGAEIWMMGKMASLVDGMAAAQKAPIPDDPGILSRDIKAAAIFSGPMRRRMQAASLRRLLPQLRSKEPGERDPGGVEPQVRHRDPHRSGLDDRRSLYGPRLDKQCHEHALLFQLRIHRDNPRRVHSPPRLSREGSLRVELSGGSSAYPLWAGLGEMSRIGDCILHPFMGPRFKGAVVTTDLPLALTSPSISACRTSAPSVRSVPANVPRGALATGARRCTTATRNGRPMWRSARRCARATRKAEAAAPA